MPWVKIEPRLINNKKINHVSHVAQLLYIKAICFCNQAENDGHIGQHDIPILAAISRIHEYDGLVSELVDARLFELDENGDGWWIHDYAVYQPTRSSEARRRELGRQNQALHRNPNVRAAIHLRDGDQCRYCGIDVDWQDRRGPDGATYDKIEPSSRITLDNTVVSCRSCSQKKAGRTLEESGLVLLPPPQEQPTVARLYPISNSVTNRITSGATGRISPVDLNALKGARQIG